MLILGFLFFYFFIPFCLQRMCSSTHQEYVVIVNVASLFPSAPPPCGVVDSSQNSLGCTCITEVAAIRKCTQNYRSLHRGAQNYRSFNGGGGGAIATFVVLHNSFGVLHPFTSDHAKVLEYC